MEKISSRVRQTWPEKGVIKFTDVDMRYQDSMPLALKDINIIIQARERIAVVGKTGAGKSSILAALFRTVELASGTIKIDGVDIKMVGLEDLRSKISVVPQDPTLFSGTIRSVGSTGNLAILRAECR